PARIGSPTTPPHAAARDTRGRQSIRSGGPERGVCARNRAAPRRQAELRYRRRRSEKRRRPAAPWRSEDDRTLLTPVLKTIGPFCEWEEPMTARLAPSPEFRDGRSGASC